MRDKQKKQAAEPTTIWERAEPVDRPAPKPLSRDRIVRAAISIADAEGLDAVSLRKVGAALDAGPMRLYGYVASKEELLQLMVDAMYGELPPVAPLGGWRETLRSIAQAIRQATGRHRWLIDLFGGRPHMGPNALAHLESSLAALVGGSGSGDIDAAMQALRTINAYVVGAVRNESSELRAELESGMDKTEWQTSLWPYLQRMLETGRFPTLAKVVGEATHPSPDVVFEKGLECVLDGIGARLFR